MGDMDKNADRTSGTYDSDLNFYVASCNNYGQVEGDGNFGSIAGGVIGYTNVKGAWKKQKVTLSVRQCANYAKVNATKNFGGVCGKIAVETNENYYDCAYVAVSDCMNAGDIGVDGSGYGICGNLEMWMGKCSLDRCINIGDCDDAITKTPVYVNNFTGIVNITNYTKEYIAYYVNRAQKEKAADIVDIGLTYMSQDASLDSVSDVLSSEYGMELKQIGEYDVVLTGTYNGEEVIEFYQEDGGEVSFTRIPKWNIYGYVVLFREWLFRMYRNNWKNMDLYKQITAMPPEILSAIILFILRKRMER